MSPEQLTALLALMADLRLQISALHAENSALRQQAAEPRPFQPEEGFL